MLPAFVFYGGDCCVTHLIVAGNDGQEPWKLFYYLLFLYLNSWIDECFYGELRIFKSWQKFYERHSTNYSTT